MSETEHYIGKLTPTDKTLEQYLDGVVLPNYCDNMEEYFYDVYEEFATIIKGKVYEIQRESLDNGYDIFESTKNEDGTIAFHVKYYNGGCGFEEALQEALK